MKTYQITIPGEPMGKERPRFTGRGAYTPEKTAAYEKLAVTLFHARYHAAELLEGPLQAVVEARFPVPVSYTAAQKRRCYDGSAVPAKKPDADNIAKVVLDALNGHAYRDDAQIVSLVVIKSYVKDRTETPHVTVAISERP